MKRLTWIGLPLVLGLLLAGLSWWPQVATSAHAATTPVKGSWQVVPSPTINVSNSTFGARLNAVAVVSSTDVWAVGFDPLPGGAAFVKQTLIEHWNGTKWSIVPSPNPPANFANVESEADRASIAVGASDVAAQRLPSSAWKTIGGGMVRPRTCAVLRFTTSSNLSGRSTGRSAAFGKGAQLFDSGMRLRRDS